MKKVALEVLVAVVLLTALLLGLFPEALEPEAIRHFILAFGPAAPLAFTAVYCLAVFLPYGTTLLSMAAGLAFGLVSGTVLVFVVTLFASLIPMSVARRLGRDWVEDRIGGTRVEKYADLINRNAFLVFFYLRLVPALPYEVQNYIAGISRITYRQFLLASFLGNGPIVFILVFLGDSLTDPGSPGFWLAAGIFLLALVAPPLIALALQRLGKESLWARLSDP